MTTTAYAVPLPTSPSCHVSLLGGRRYHVRLEATFQAGWAGKLAGGLAARDISILRASAQRVAPSTWWAELEIEVRGTATDVASIDFLALTRGQADPLRAVGGVELWSFRVVPTPQDVVVELTARDSVGFLDRILRVFAFYGLFPHVMRVETHGAVVEDTFRLASLTGGPPAPALLAALNRRLGELVED